MTILVGAPLNSDNKREAAAISEGPGPNLFYLSLAGIVYWISSGAVLP